MLLLLLRSVIQDAQEDNTLALQTERACLLKQPVVYQQFNPQCAMVLADLLTQPAAGTSTSAAFSVAAEG